MKRKVRSKLIHFRASAGEYAAYIAIAEQEQISLSETGRLILREAAERRSMGAVGFIEGQPKGGEHEQP
jgi:hypothetical protein